MILRITGFDFVMVGSGDWWNMVEGDFQNLWWSGVAGTYGGRELFFHFKQKSAIKKILKKR